MLNINTTSIPIVSELIPFRSPSITRCSVSRNRRDVNDRESPRISIRAIDGDEVHDSVAREKSELERNSNREMHQLQSLLLRETLQKFFATLVPENASRLLPFPFSPRSSGTSRWIFPRIYSRIDYPMLPPALSLCVCWVGRSEQKIIGAIICVSCTRFGKYSEFLWQKRRNIGCEFCQLQRWTYIHINGDNSKFR